MTIGHVLAVLGLVALIGFIIFAFRQGLKVKPDGSGNSHSGYSGSDGGGGGGHGGGH